MKTGHQYLAVPLTVRFTTADVSYLDRTALARGVKLSVLIREAVALHREAARKASGG